MSSSDVAFFWWRQDRRTTAIHGDGRSGAQPISPAIDSISAATSPAPIATALSSASAGAADRQRPAKAAPASALAARQPRTGRRSRTRARAPRGLAGRRGDGGEAQDLRLLQEAKDRRLDRHGGRETDLAAGPRPYGRVTAPSDADATCAAYLANTPVR